MDPIETLSNCFHMNGITERKLWVSYITFIYSIYNNANGFTEGGGGGLVKNDVILNETCR